MNRVNFYLQTKIKVRFQIQVEKLLLTNASLRVNGDEIPSAFRMGKIDEIIGINKPSAVAISTASLVRIGTMGTPNIQVSNKCGKT